MEIWWNKPDYKVWKEGPDPEWYYVYPEISLREDSHVQGRLSEVIELDGIDDRETVEGVYAFLVRAEQTSSADNRYNSGPERCHIVTTDRGMFRAEYITHTETCACV